MDLREFLLHKTNVGDIVVIQDAGWQTGLTMIDNEDLFYFQSGSLYAS